MKLSDLPGWPRGLRRELACAYLGLKPTKFDEMVKDGRLPPPARIDGVVVWDRLKLDAAFEALDADHEDKNEWDDV